MSDTLGGEIKHHCLVAEYLWDAFLAMYMHQSQTKLQTY